MLPSRGRGKQYRENRDIRREVTRSQSNQNRYEQLNSEQLTSREISPNAPGTSTLKRNEVAISPEELGIQFKRKLECTSDLPTRPGGGRLGKRIKLISNCYPVTVPSGYVYHYDVTITRKNINTEQSSTALVLRDDKYRCLNTRKNREIITLMLNTNPLFNGTLAAYDGRKNIFTRFPLHASFPVKSEVVLPNENHNPEDPDGQQQDVFVVEIKPVTKKEDSSYSINLDLLHAFLEKRISSLPQEVLMALETILRHGPCLRFVPIGHSFFSPPRLDNLHPLGGGIEVWFGHHQSIRLGQWGPMVNLDVTATAFYQKGPVLKYIAECMNVPVRELRRRPILPNTDVKRISNELKNLKIEVTHLRNYRRKYRVVRMVKESAHRLEFDMTENGRVVKKTVAAYFRERYNRILEFPNLPCLQVAPENKKIYLPVEVCEIIDGQHFKKKLDPRQTTEMIKFTANPPAERFSKIKQIANDAGFNNDRLVQEFNLRVSDKPICLEGRILDSPTIQYNRETVKPKDGSWNMKQSKFLHGAIIDSWVLLSFANLDVPTLKKFSNYLVKMGQETGMSIKSPELIDVIDTSRCDIETLITAMKTEYYASLAVIVLPTNDKFVYGKIKQAAETVIGLVTQCIKEGNITNPRKCSPQLLNNLCQKINAKMGGQNSTLLYQEMPRIMCKPIIIIGADVNHPGASRGIKPSLAACAGSLDMKLSRYAISIRAQVNMDERKQSVEIICDLKNMVLELLKAFYRHTNRMKPETIIFYRDGVSEGQFQKVRDHEVKCIREACRTLGQDYQPGITFIVVQKRHHIRFMPENPRDGIGTMRNIPPGTTVDTDVTHPSNFDFFLCSHFGIKGTSRPSHYTVMEDDNNFTADELQKLTYQLCHTYARCTRSISIPVPVAYADLAAYRARTHLESVLEDSTSSCDSSDGFEGQRLPQSVIDAIKVMDGLKNAMYYV